MEPISTAVLAKWAGPQVSRFAVNRFGSLSRRWRVSRAAAKRAAAAGIPVTRKSIHTWLSREDTVLKLQQCTEHSLAETAAQLVFLIPGSDIEQRQRGSLRVLQIVMEEYVRTAAPAEALLTTSGWALQTTADEAAKTREKIEEAQSGILGRLDAHTEFAAMLASFSPWSAQAARDLLPAWQVVETVISVLHDADSARNTVLEQWATHEPEWLTGAPPNALAWLGQVAADYDAPQASRFFFERSFHQGGHPRDYLVARAALQATSDEEVRDYLAAHEVAGSPLHSALRAFLDQDWTACLERLAGWEPHNANARTLKVQTESEALLKTGEDGKALALLRAAEQDGAFTSVSLRLADVLLQRAAGGRTGNRLADAQEALAAAIRARNSRRGWNGDSVTATIVAVQAAHMGGDVAGAWTLTQPPPDGEALPREAQDSRLCEQTAVVAALTGRMQDAERLSAEAKSAFTRAQVAAMIAQYRAGEDGEGEHSEPVRALWRKAWDAAQTDSDQLTAAVGLVESGGDLPDLSHLQAVFPDAVAEITLVARALKGGAGDELALLRANVARSPMIAIKLAQRYQLRGDLDLAAQTLREGADRWHDAQLMAMAAGRFQYAREYSRARECAQDALRMAGAGWAGQGSMYALLVEVEGADGRIERATDAAISLLALDPRDPGARWALVKCYAARAMPEEAWSTLGEPGAPLDPRTRDEAMLWVQLGARFSTDPQFTGRALTLMQQWPQDEELLGRFLQTLTTIARAEPLSEEDGELLRAATAQYLEQFPDSSVLRAVPANTGADLLVGIADELRQNHENFREGREKIHNGELPLGVLTLTGRTYAEACLRRAAGRVYAAWFPASDADVRAVDASRTTRTVLDTTAAHTLALLDPDVVEQLIGHAHAVTTTDQLLGDALRAKESLAVQSEMTVHWDEHTNAAVVSSVTPEEMAHLRDNAARMVDIMQGIARVSRPELRCFPTPGEHSKEWLTAIDYAKEHALVLWCDDRVLRAVAHAEGVAAFGTLDLVDTLHDSRVLASDVVMAIKAELVRSYFVDLPFSPELHSAAAQVDGWRAKAVAAALGRPTTWTDPQIAAKFALDAAARVIGTLPDEARNWLYVACTGLSHAYPDARAQNLKIFSWQTLTQSWVSTESFPFVLAGLQAGIQTAADGQDPLRSALADYHRALVARFGHAPAATQFMNLFALTGPEDKATAARIVLTYREA